MTDPLGDVAFLQDVVNELRNQVHDLQWELGGVRARMLCEIRRLRRALLLLVEDWPNVVSAFDGIKLAAPSVMTEGVRVWISIAILTLLFMVQRFGTDKVGSSFAYVLCVWFNSIAGIGIYNIAKYDPTVFKALNPKYIIEYFKRNKKNAWISIGGVVMCITGVEGTGGGIRKYKGRRSHGRGFTQSWWKLDVCNGVCPDIARAIGVVSRRELYHGIRGCRSMLHYQQLKQSTLQLLKLAKKCFVWSSTSEKNSFGPFQGALGSSSSWLRFPLSILKLAVEIFDGTGHFGMWQGEVLDSLFQQGLNIAIEEKKSEKDEDLALMLLSSILDEFKHLETMLLYEKENVSLDVCSALYSHELRKQDNMKTKSATSEEALVARGYQQSQDKRRRGRSKSKGRGTGRKTIQS
ncbi:hypothetical protein FXO37_00739 [Capsicum annuum]|nr:hypothetical protein FXO37_00739 [Capsicum annuum]